MHGQAHAATPRIHPTAIVESEVQIGSGTAVWDGVHIRGPARIGHDCIVGEKTYIAYGVSVGNFVKINAHVYICTGVTIEDGVMIAAGVIFANDRFPRAFDDLHEGLASSEVTADTLRTTVGKGATLGAGAMIGPGIEIGPFALIGMGSVVVANVPAHALAYGNPARVRGYVCECGIPLKSAGERPRMCERCHRAYRLASRGPEGVQLLIEQ
jgi:UDP-2-acetamido-3-amino-2,3-dideoxy-glucuronate N-acetyltransferase